LESGADLEERAHPAVELRATCGWFRIRERILSKVLFCAIEADDPDGLTPRHLERDILQGPDRIRGGALAPAATTDHVTDVFAESAIPWPARPGLKSLEEPLSPNRDATHTVAPPGLGDEPDIREIRRELSQTRSAKVRSSRRKLYAPPTTSATDTMLDTASIGPGAEPVFSRAQRKPSTTPAMGLMP